MPTTGIDPYGLLYRAVRNLLVVIHADEGRFVDQHGVIHSCEVAETIVNQLRRELVRAQVEVAELQEQLYEGGTR